MAKKKKLEDLDAELAALEAELAALEGRAAAPPRPKPAPPAPAPAAPEAPAPEAPKKRGLPSFGRKKQAEAPAAEATEPPAAKAASVEPAAAEPAAEKPKKLAIPSFGRKKKDAPDPAPAAAAEPAPVNVPVKAAAPARVEKAPEVLPPGDLTHWRQEGGAWIRTVPDHEGPIVRRILDENDAVVREEPATRADVHAARGTKDPERGVGRLLGGAAAGAANRLKGFRLGRRGGEGGGAA